MATAILILMIACLAGWLGYKYTLATTELTRIKSLSEFQKKYIEELGRVSKKEEETRKVLQKIDEATNEEELNAIYNDIIS